MLASCSDDGSFARKYELSYGRSGSKRLSERLQGLIDPAEPSSYGSGDEAHRRELQPSHRHGALRRRAEAAALVRVDELDTLKAQRPCGTTYGARDNGWTAPSDAFLELTRPRPEVAAVEGIYAVRCLDQLSYLEGRGDSTRRCQSRPPMPPADVTLYRVDGKARREATGRAGGRFRRRVGIPEAWGSLYLSYIRVW